MKKIILILCILIVSFSLAVSQVKVGTSGTPFLDMSSSVKANGMGQIGVTVVGNRSYFSNPAILGFSSVDKLLSVSSFLNWSEVSSNSEFFNRSISLPILHKQVGDADYYFGVAYYRSKFNEGPFTETTYERGTISGSDKTFSWDNKSDNFVLSIACIGTIDIAVGLTVKYLSQEFNEYSVDGHAYDFGGIVRYNKKKIISENSWLYFIPAIGYSTRNVGMDLIFIENYFHLPTSKTIGLSVEFGLQKEYGNNQTGTIFEVVPAIEFEKQYYDDTVDRLGLELSLYEIINFRIGNISSDKFSESETTFGLTLSTFRFGKFLKLMSAYEKTYNSGILDFFYNDVNIEYNYASYDRYFTTEVQNYHELVVHIQL